MGKNQSASNLTNIIKQDANGNILLVSGSTTLMSISSSGAIATTGNVAGTASYASNAELLDGLDSTVFTLTSSFTAQTASFTAFTSSVNTFTASQNILNGTYATTGSNTFTGIQTVNSNLVVTGSITAQTLVVQTITSSVDFVTGSTRFGSLSSNTHVFTGSMYVTGAFYVTTGSVGIGTTSPSQKLQVDGRVRVSDSSGNGGDMAVNDSGLAFSSIGAAPIEFFTSNYSTERMRIAANGNVGIGTTIFTGWSSTMVLRIQGISGSTTSVLQALSYDSGSGVWMYSGASSADEPSMIYLKDLRFGSATDLGTGGYNERMRITSTGLVGIGTNNPQSLLDVTNAIATAYDSTNTLTSGQTMRIANTNTTSGVSTNLLFIATGAGGGNGLGSMSGVNTGVGSLALTFGTRDSGGAVIERMRITSVGHVIKPYQPYFKYGVAYTGTITSATRFGTNYGFTVNTDRDAVDSPYFNKATGLFTAPIAGVYIFGCTIMRNATSGTGPVDIWICKNPNSLAARANSYGRGYVDAYSAEYQQITFVVPIKLAANDTVGLGMGGNMTVYNDDSWFYGYLLG